MGIVDIFKASSIKRENIKLTEFIKEIGAADAVSVKRKIDDLEIVLIETRKKKTELEASISSLSEQVEKKSKELIVLDDEILLESFALYKPKFSFMSSEEYKSKLDVCRELQKNLIKSGNSVTANENWTVNNSKSEGRKMVNDMKKLLVRSFNNECDYCIDNVKFNNIETSETRIEKSYETLNKLGRIMQATISGEYKKLKYDELHIAFEYQQKKQEEKEEQKKVREELREQQKVEQEIRQAREEIAKEKKHFSKAIDELESKLKAENNEEEKIAIQERLVEVKSQLVELVREENVIDYREKNAKAGYVYIISNIGAFGEGVYKIGMTRRLEPVERIDELGDASVPFLFDIHAMIFSDNAPALEGKIHERFKNTRINKVNYRKEFFRADINELEKVIKENYDKAIDIIKEAPAERYRESLLLKNEKL